MSKNERLSHAWEAAPTYSAYLAYVEGYEGTPPTGGSRFPTALTQELEHWQRQGYDDLRADS